MYFKDKSAQKFFNNLNHCKMKTIKKVSNTGLTLSEIKGPLDNLLDNLSGEHADYWLDAIKKLLRKERLPEPPADVAFTKGLNTKIKALAKLKKWINFLNTIPVVYRTEICRDYLQDLIDIEVAPNLLSFLHSPKDEDKALFCLKKVDGSVEYFNDSSAETDEIFDKWHENKYKDIYTFFKALIELGEMYEKAVPEFSMLIEFKDGWQTFWKKQGSEKIVQAKGGGPIRKLGDEVVSNGRMFKEKGTKGVIEKFQKDSCYIGVKWEDNSFTYMKDKDLVN